MLSSGPKLRSHVLFVTIGTPVCPELIIVMGLLTSFL